MSKRVYGSITYRYGNVSVNIEEADELTAVIAGGEIIDCANSRLFYPRVCSMRLVYHRYEIIASPSRTYFVAVS